jgi:hypothetical protein
MSNKIANRRSPSGPLIADQLGFGNVSPVTAATVFALISGIGSDPTEAGTEYEVPAAGKLGTLQVRNNPVGDDAVNATYQARKNGADVGDPVIIGNNAVGPVKVDLSAITVLPGDLISLSVTAPAFAGAAPIGRVTFTYIPSTSASS